MSTYLDRERPIYIEREVAAAGFIMALLGGFFLVVNGVALGVVGAGYTYMDPEYYLGYYFGSDSAYYMIAMGVVCGFLGLIVLTGAALVKMGSSTGGGLISIIFSTFAVFFGGGFLVGTVFGVIGGVLAILERR